MKQISEQTGICFFKVETPIALAEFLRTRDFSPLAVEASPLLVRDWLDFGCIYVDGVRRREDVALAPGQIVRLHTRRKTYPVDADSLRELIVTETDEFLVLDKPSGLPTHPTLDNYRENAKFRLESELEIPLYTTHRLDVPTQGLLLLAKTPDAQRLFNKAFSLGRVEKIYRCLNSAAVSTGLYTHFIDPAGRVPRPIRSEETPGWWRVRMEILASGTHAEGHWHEIKLLTGKTHQIRAQMTALGTPILGDTLYGGEQDLGANRIALECLRLGFMFRSKTYVVERPRSLRGY